MALNPESRELSPRTDSARYHRVTLTLEQDGALVLRSHDMGGSVEAAWGLDDEEVTVSVPAEAIGRLTLALAAELLKGGQDSVDRLTEICEAHDVPFRTACWS